MPLLKANGRNVIECDSPQHAAAHWDSLSSKYCLTSGNELEWYNNETEYMTRERSNKGDTTALRDAQALMGRLNPGWTAPAIQMIPEVHGAFPVVPEYLAGEPECMRTLVTHADASAPIRLFVDLTSSAGINSAKMLKRGTTILALALTLQQIRPVELFAFCAMKGYRMPDHPSVRASAMTVRLNLQDSLMAQSVYALASAGFARRVIYDAMRKMGFDGHWADYSALGAPYGQTGNAAYITAVRWHLGLNPEDILIPGISLYDGTTTDPDKWLQEMLVKVERHLAGAQGG